MRLWASLYGMIWIVLVEVLLGMMPAPPTWVLYLHLLLGLGIIALAYRNREALRATRAPGRIKRVANATVGLAVLVALLGLLIWFHVGHGWATFVPGYTIYTVLVVFHAINAFAVLTQAAAVAIAFDMWEDREFTTETEAGVIPAVPRP